MRIRDGVRRRGVSIQVDHTVREAAVVMERAGVGSLVVLDGDDVVGIVTDRDLVRRAMAKGLDQAARVDGVMTMPVISVDAEAEIETAFGRFRDSAVRRLVVTEDDRLFGVLTVDDLVIDITSLLTDLARPLTAETIFGQHDSAVPATS